MYCLFVFSVYQTTFGEFIYDVHRILAKFDRPNLSSLFLNPCKQLHQNVFQLFTVDIIFEHELLPPMCSQLSILHHLLCTS